MADQVAHILSEIDEAAVEMEAVNLSGAIVGHTAFYNINQLLPLLRELGDVQASIETLWGVVDRIFSEGTSERLILSWIEEKNRARGYYVETRVNEMEIVDKAHKWLKEPPPDNGVPEPVEIAAAREIILGLLNENEDLAQNVCSECSPENYGWIFNRVEGKAVCGCIQEAEPFQILKEALERMNRPQRVKFRSRTMIPKVWLGSRKRQSRHCG
jgi:hypothetical protein